MSLLLAACGAGPATSEPGRDAASAGAEIAAPPPPEGPPRSFVPQGTVVIARFDLRAMRATPSARGWADILRVQSAYRTVLEESGIDPLEHLDHALVLAPELYTNATTFVLRHREGARGIRARIDRTAATTGQPAAWREGQGYPVAHWPCRSPVPHEAVITGEREIVIAPEGSFAAIVDVARDHRARSPRGEMIEPAFASEPGEIVRFWVTQVPPSLTLARHAIAGADLSVRLIDGRRTLVALDFRMLSDADAADARVELERIAAMASSEPMLSGLARILALVRVDQRSDHAIAFATLGDEEVETSLAAMRIAAPLLGM